MGLARVLIDICVFSTSFALSFNFTDQSFAQRWFGEPDGLCGFSEKLVKNCVILSQKPEVGQDLTINNYCLYISLLF